MLWRLLRLLQLLRLLRLLLRLRVELQLHLLLRNRLLLWHQNVANRLLSSKLRVIERSRRVLRILHLHWLDKLRLRLRLRHWHAHGLLGRLLRVPLSRHCVKLTRRSCVLQLLLRNKVHRLRLHHRQSPLLELQLRLLRSGRELLRRRQAPRGLSWLRCRRLLRDLLLSLTFS